MFESPFKLGNRSLPATGSGTGTVIRALEQMPATMGTLEERRSRTMTTQIVTFGAGCFWGVEYVFRRVPGVTSVEVGYSGGITPDPTYREVCSHTTGHAEVLQVQFDDEQVSFDQLLEVFWAMHDPTQVNRQGPDIGDQYRSVIFTSDDTQLAAADASRDRAQLTFPRPIATEIRDAPTFYPAEDYHQAYYEKNGHEPYCHVVPVRLLEELGLVTSA
jgi:peptide-methionine (S)-S-oxide reductase